jgi:hypothetical protein
LFTTFWRFVSDAILM